jgi:hypothetical protein
VPSVSGAALPPADVAALAPLHRAARAAAGPPRHRAALVERATGQPGPGARHLALYVEPTRTFADAERVANIVPLGRAVTPCVFGRWPGLESYDICQEPSPGVDDRAEQETQTVLDVSRPYAEGTDWAEARLAELVADMRNRRPGILVGVASRLQPVLDAAAR